VKFFLAALLLCAFFQSPETMAAGEVQNPSRLASLKAYPGGRDESDLSVQPKKRVTRKSEDVDLEQFEAGVTDVGPPPSNESFGE
jgi:hypothetical protein